MKHFPREFRAIIVDEGRYTDPFQLAENNDLIVAQSETIALENYPKLKPCINEHIARENEYLDFGSHVASGKRAIEFYVKLNRSLLTEIIASTDQRLIDRGVDPRKKNFNQTDTMTGFCIYNGILRDLEYFAAVMIIAGHISNSAPFKSYRIFTCTSLDRINPSRFNLYPPFHHIAYRNNAIFQKFFLRTIDIKTVFLRLRERSKNNNVSSFTRSIAYFVTGMQQQEPATRLIWFIATIESLLLEKGEKSTTIKTIALAKAKLHNEHSELADYMDKLYKLRNEFLHGSKDIRVILGGSELYPRGKIEGESLLWCHQEADIAHLVAHSLIQSLIENNTDRL